MNTQEAMGNDALYFVWRLLCAALLGCQVDPIRIETQKAEPRRHLTAVSKPCDATRL